MELMAPTPNEELRTAHDVLAQAPRDENQQRSTFLRKHLGRGSTALDVLAKAPRDEDQKLDRISPSEPSGHDDSTPIIRKTYRQRLE